MIFLNYGGSVASWFNGSATSLISGVFISSLSEECTFLTHIIAFCKVILKDLKAAPNLWHLK